MPPAMSLRTHNSSLESAFDWLKKNAPHIKIKKWGGAKSKKSIFVDTNRDKEFERTFFDLQTKLKRDPNVFFDITPEEKMEKIKDTNLKNIGREFLFSGPEGSEIAKSGMIERYGESNPALVPESLEKKKQTNMVKYGHENPASSDSVKEKIAATNVSKYGASSPLNNSEIKSEIRERKIASGTIATVYGSTLKEYAEDLGVHYSGLNRHYRTFGQEFVKNFCPDHSSIEQVIASILQRADVQFEWNKYIGGKVGEYRPDFLVPSHRLVIECDGLYWHSEDVLAGRGIDGRKYHLQKKEFFRGQGLTPLFFREDEIRDKTKIVESIILNKLGQSKKIYARKCKVVEVSRGDSKEFFEQNHLMGDGSGKCIGLQSEGELVSCLSFKFKSKKDKEIEISRFCNISGTTVIGGFSKCISKILQTEHISKIVSFVDERYGDGSSLQKLGWKMISCHPSFKWTNNKKTFHRMKWPGNSGYEHSMKKIWDCGQSKWEFDNGK
jgi:very-short-patch-repair endonuclease